MGGRPARARYREPLTAILLRPVLFMALGFINSFFLFFGVGAAVGRLFIWLTRGPALELTETDVVVRAFVTSRVPWPAVARIRRGEWWRGGILLQTSEGKRLWAAAPCSWWGGPPDRRSFADIERRWIEHRGVASSVDRPVTPQPVRLRARYRTADLVRQLAVAGLGVAAVNAAALWWPQGGFTVLFVEVMKPDLDHLGWSLLAALTAGLAIGAAWTAGAHRVLTRGSPPRSPDGAPEGRIHRVLSVVLAVGALNAILQWLGLVPAIGSLTLIALGLAAAVSGAPLASAVRRFEQRSGATVLSTGALSTALGLEARPLGGR